jgi:hypothetical protein
MGQSLEEMHYRRAVLKRQNRPLLTVTQKADFQRTHPLRQVSNS